MTSKREASECRYSWQIHGSRYAADTCWRLLQDERGALIGVVKHVIAQPREALQRFPLFHFTFCEDRMCVCLHGGGGREGGGGKHLDGGVLGGAGPRDLSALGPLQNIVLIL